MPSYAKPFGMAGGAAGAAGGGLLGQLLGGLNMPRKALWALPGRLAQGDYLGALPALAGVGAGLGAAMTPGLEPFAGMIGSAVGGLGEGAEEATRPDMQQAPEPSDLVKALGGDPNTLGGGAASMALGMAGDPLSWAGGETGGAIGSRGGKYLEGEALARGPMYPGGKEKLTGLLDQLGGMDPDKAAEFRNHIEGLLQSPDLPRILGEVEPGSTPGGSGVEAAYLNRASAGGTRLAGEPGAWRVADDNPFAKRDWTSAPPQARVADPAMLQAVRDRAIGPVRIEQMPTAQMFDEDNPNTPLGLLIQKSGPALADDVASRGLKTTDMHNGNMGVLPSGNVAITDPSNIRAPGDMPERIPEGKGGWLTSKLLDLLGSNESVRNEINQGVALGGGSAGLSPEQIAEYHSIADANLPPTLRGGGPVGPNAGLPTNQDQASELMKALGLEMSPSGPGEQFGLLDAMEGRIPGLTGLPKAQPTMPAGLRRHLPLTLPPR